MADQRRRGGRNKSGRGGRIPRRGESHGPATAPEETAASFPLQVSNPLAVTSALDPGAVESVLCRTLERERRLAGAVQALSEGAADPVLADLRVQVERHRDVLAQLGRDLGAELSRAGDGTNGGTDQPDIEDIVARQRLARLGWLTLQNAAYASGDRRIDRVVKPVLREKERHAEVLETYALRRFTQALFREPEE